MAPRKTPNPKAATPVQCVASPTRRPYVEQRCTRPAVNRFLCQTHQALLNRERKAAATAEKVEKIEASNVVPVDFSKLPGVMATEPLPASPAAFATPELAETARAKRSARRTDAGS